MEENNQVSDNQEAETVDEETDTAEIGESVPDDEETIKELPQTSIASFWHRLFAFIIDGVVVAIPLIILSFAIRDVAFSLGPWGRIIGYALIIPYWGYFNSEKRSGQTIGKQVTKIAVVDNNNQFISISKSFLRAFILGLIFMLNSWALPILQNPVIIIMVAVIVGGGMLVLIYGLVFNGTTRQGIHDLLVGSYVINAPPNIEAVTPQIPRIHQQLTYGLLGLCLLIGIVGLVVQRTQPTLGILETGEWEEIQQLQSSLMGSGEFFSVNVNRFYRSRVGRSEVLIDMNIEVWAKTSCKRNPGYCDELAKEVAHTVFKEYDNIENLSGMRIAVINRFDLGLASGNITQSAAWSIEDWQKELEN